MEKTGKKRVFVGVPMAGRSDALILRSLEVTKRQYCHIKKVSMSDIDFVDNYTENYLPFIGNGGSLEQLEAEVKRPDMAWLSCAMILLYDCDEAVFGYNWHKSRGCKVEATACTQYGIPQVRICRKGFRDKIPEESRKKLEKYEEKHGMTMVDMGVLQKELHEKHMKAIEVGRQKLQKEQKG